MKEPFTNPDEYLEKAGDPNPLDMNSYSTVKGPIEPTTETVTPATEEATVPGYDPDAYLLKESDPNPLEMN